MWFKLGPVAADSTHVEGSGTEEPGADDVEGESDVGANDAGTELVLSLIEQLEEHEEHLSAQRKILHGRIDEYSDELASRRERKLSAVRREVHRQIDRLHLHLAAFLRRSDDR